VQTADYLTLLNILVAFLGVAFAVVAYVEWRSLNRLRQSFEAMQAAMRAENYRAMKAAHRVISSYNVKDVDARISLLQSALQEYPAAFNGYNALGYAYLEKKQYAKSIDAFSRAVALHPKEKSGYCDLACAYLAAGEEDLAVQYLRQAIEVDASAAEDIKGDTRLAHLQDRIMSCRT